MSLEDFKKDIKIPKVNNFQYKRFKDRYEKLYDKSKIDEKEGELKKITSGGTRIRIKPKEFKIKELVNEKNLKKTLASPLKIQKIS